MKKISNYLYLALGTLMFFSCDFSDDVKDVTTHSGTADFTTYIALGNSLTAGYQDGALYKSGQENSFPAMIAQGMNLSYEFSLPLMADDLGGIPTAGVPNKFILAATAAGLKPVRAEGTGTSTLQNIYNGNTFHNLGVPGAKVAHLLAPGYGNPAGLVATPATANPYYVRFASSTTSSVIADALAAKPTFYSLWIGNNDVQYYEAIVKQLVGAGAKGVVANIPYVSTIPFFTTVPNNALKLDAGNAKKLTLFFTAVEGILTQGLIAQGVPAEQAKDIAAQYAITFAEGDNRFLIETEKTKTNPLGFRQMSEEELLVLTIDQNAIKTQGYGSVAITDEIAAILAKLATGNNITSAEGQKVLNAVNPINDGDALDVEELALIKNSVDAYNTTIKL